MWFNNWDVDVSNNPFLDFKRKIKKIKKVLTIWSRKIYGDIFQQLIISEEIARIKDQLFEKNPSAKNIVVIQKAKAEDISYLHLEESY